MLPRARSCVTNHPATGSASSIQTRFGYSRAKRSGDIEKITVEVPKIEMIEEWYEEPSLEEVTVTHEVPVIVEIEKEYEIPMIEMIDAEVEYPVEEKTEHMV